MDDAGHVTSDTRPYFSSRAMLKVWEWLGDVARDMADRNVWVVKITPFLSFE